jgi:hypothetical protein
MQMPIFLLRLNNSNYCKLVPDDGTFLIELAEKLVIFYRDQLSRSESEPQLKDNTENIVSRVEQLGKETNEMFR